MVHSAIQRKTTQLFSIHIPVPSSKATENFFHGLSWRDSIYEQNASYIYNKYANIFIELFALISLKHKLTLPRRYVKDRDGGK